jgi:two-component system sensor histidine kinase DctS
MLRRALTPRDTSPPRSGAAARSAAGHGGIGGLISRHSAATVPVLAIVLIVILIGILLWLVDRDEREEAHLALIKDVLWVEQSLQFQIGVDEDDLSRLAAEIGRQSISQEHFLSRARHLVTNSPEIVRIVWRAPDGAVRVTVPPAPEPIDPGAYPASVRLAVSTGRPVFTAVYKVDNEALFDVVAPVFTNGAFAGSLVATIALDALLARNVPWWIAEKYQIAFVDPDGAVLARKSQIGAPREDAAAHAIAFDPPVRGLLLSVTPYRSKTNFGHNALIGTIFGLALVAIVNLLIVYRHFRRRLAAEQALRAEHAFRKAMEDSLTVGMRARDLRGRITYVNPAFCRMVGWSADELVGRDPPMPYWEPEMMEDTLARHEEVLSGAASSEGFELRFRRRNGERFDALIYEAPLVDAEGRHIGWMGSVLDVTDRKHAEELARQQTEKLQATGRLITMGEMASTLAHELNQPLAAIASYGAGCLNLLRSGTYDPAELVEALEKLGTQAQRAGSIIHRVYDFVRKREPQFGHCDLVSLVQETVAFAAGDARRNGVRLKVAVGGGVPAVAVDRVLIEQVLLNLIRNAADAMAGLPRDSRVITVTVGVTADGEPSIAVDDRGHGIPADIAGRVFQPFVTTKREGMGMGLNICRSIVELHKGRLWFEPRDGGGTRFLVVLPGASAEAAA